MSASVNKVFIVGNLGQNPELRHNNTGLAVATLSVATNHDFTDKQGVEHKRTEWHRVVVWGKSAEACAKYLSKGRPVHVEGELQTRKWTDKEGVDRYTTEIRAERVQFLGSGQGGGGGARPPHPGDDESDSDTGGGGSGFTEDDIPF